MAPLDYDPIYIVLARSCWVTRTLSDLIDFCLDDALLPHSPSRYANLV